MANLLQKNDSGEFYVTITDAYIGSLKSFHTLFDKYLDPLNFLDMELYGTKYTKF